MTKKSDRLGRYTPNDWNPDKTFGSQTTSLGRLRMAEYRAELQRLIVKHEPKLFLTLGYNGKTDTLVMHKTFDDFINHILTRAYGPQWYKQPITIRPRVFGFFEHEQTNAHAHLLVCAKKKFRLAAKRFGSPTWRKLVSNAHFHCTKIRTQPGSAIYCTKELKKMPKIANYYVYAPLKKNM